MDYNSIVSIASSILNVSGTIIAVLSLLKMSMNDIWRTATVNHLKDMPLPTLVQVFQARLGISLIIVALILNICSTVIMKMSFNSFILLTITTITFLCVFIIIIFYKYQSDRSRIKKLQNKINT